MHAVGYIRYDKHLPPDSAMSRRNQQNRLVAFARKNGHTLRQLFVDAAPEDNAQGYTDLLNYLQRQAEEFLVLINDPSQLSMTLEGAVDAVLSVNGLGSSVVCTIDGLPDPVQALYRTMTSEGQNAAKRQQIMQAMQDKALRGEGLGKPPYGYSLGNQGKFEVVPHEAEVVRLIFRLYLEGSGLRTITRRLNESGYRTRRGRNWNMVTLRDMLRNRAYMGTYQRFGLRLPNNHPAIVSSEDSRRVQDLMSSRKPLRRSGESEPFLLSGMVFCASCGNRMIGVTRRQAWRTKDGRRKQGSYRYYQCQTRANQSQCQYHTKRASDLETSVKQYVTDAKGESLEQRDPGATGEGMRENDVSQRLYLKYLKQAADGSITLERLAALLRGREQLDDGWRHLLRQHVDRIDVGEDSLEIKLHPSA